MNAPTSRGLAARASVQSRSANRSNCLRLIHSRRDNQITADADRGGGGGGSGGSGGRTFCSKTTVVAHAA